MTDDKMPVLDLDAARTQRAAQREGKGQPMPIRIGGSIIATLPVELPVDVLAPLRSLDSDITLIVREAMQAAKSSGNSSTEAVTDLVIDILASNPGLPVQALDIITEVGRNLLTEEGLTALIAARPSPQDYGALAKGVFAFYGVSLGEASPSSDSSTDTSGGTSSGTSSTTSESTPEDSGTSPTPQASWEPVAS